LAQELKETKQALQEEMQQLQGRLNKMFKKFKSATGKVVLPLLLILQGTVCSEFLPHFSASQASKPFIMKIRNLAPAYSYSTL
jgi:geranylgeranyl pyrophosphate synthase